LQSSKIPSRFQASLLQAFAKDQAGPPADYAQKTARGDRAGSKLVYRPADTNAAWKKFTVGEYHVGLATGKQELTACPVLNSFGRIDCILFVGLDLQELARQLSNFIDEKPKTMRFYDFPILSANPGRIE
jgi:hypothetical protein